MSSAVRVRQRLVFKEGCPAPLVHVPLQSGDKAQSPDLARDWPAPGAFLLQQGGVSQHDDPVSVHTVCLYRCYVTVSLKALYEILNSKFRFSRFN